MNNFSGGIPHEIGNITTVLELLDLNNNHLTGELPVELGELVNLEQLDLSQNSFTGIIPESFGNYSYLDKLILNNNLLSWQISKAIRNLQKLTLLDFGFNNLSGSIPPEIGYLSSLSISLDLSHNALSGEIPEPISSLTQLQSLDLSHNAHSGKIVVLGLLTSLTSLNISDNNFSSPIPATPFFKTLMLNSFLDNKNLCQSLDGSTCSSGLFKRSGLKSGKTVALIFVILASVTVAILISWIVVSRNCRYIVQRPCGDSGATAGSEDFSIHRLSFVSKSWVSALTT